MRKDKDPGSWVAYALLAILIAAMGVVIFRFTVGSAEADSTCPFRQLIGLSCIQTLPSDLTY